MQKMFKPQAVIGSNARIENKRVILGETEQVPKSVFNIGQMRHNVIRMEELGTQMTTSAKPSRLLEWNENI